MGAISHAAVALVTRSSHAIPLSSRPEERESARLRVSGGQGIQRERVVSVNESQASPAEPPALQSTVHSLTRARNSNSRPSEEEDEGRRREGIAVTQSCVCRVMCVRPWQVLPEHHASERERGMQGSREAGRQKSGGGGRKFFVPSLFLAYISRKGDRGILV